MTHYKAGMIGALAWVLAPAMAMAAATWSETGAVPAPVTASLVQVEAVLQTDEGEEPGAPGWRTRCPNCGNFHISDVDSALKQQRPVLAPGFLIAPDRVVLADPMVEPRFVREWRVRFGGEAVSAKLAAIASDRGAMQLALAKPLAAAQPLAFVAGAKGPFFTLAFTTGADGFGTQLQPLGTNWVTKDDGRRFLPVPATAVVLAADGRPVTLTLREELSSGEAWKTAPAAWPWLSAAEYEAKLEAVRRAGEAGMLRAALLFRSPKLQPGAELAQPMDPEEAAGAGANRAAVAVVLAPRRVLVLAPLMPRQTARLEKVVLTLPDGREVEAKFVATIAELGAFVAEPAEDLAGALPISPDGWAAQRGRPLLTLRLKVQGEQRTSQPGRQRLVGIGPGLGGRATPEFAGDEKDLFFFDLAGRLVGLPVAARPIAKANRWDTSGAAFALHAGELAKFAGDPAVFADSRNVPQSAEAERRLAWLGVELQPLDRELAQVHGVLDQVERGSGALVIHVFPGSPAARAGVQVGDVLLRVQAAGAPQPVPVQVQPGQFANRPFPWDRYDEIPEAYFDQIPAPWGSAENEVALLLKDFGFGTGFRLDFSRDGKSQAAQLVVEPGPAYYATAAQTEDPAVGLTVRELTFETRRYFQIPEGEPGVIVSRVVAGSRGSVAGVKPYEIVVAVNDQPVRTAAEFAAGVKAGGALTLAVRRMHQSRVVNITPTAAP
jgi:hypothetical protein